MSTDRTGGLLLVHAHPDDEAIPTGVTMARYAAAGVPVTLVTCTLGELGEIVVEDLTHLHDVDEDALGRHRYEELLAACAELGVRDVRLLGGSGAYRDSGMMGEPTNDDPRCFWQADVATAAGHLVEILREVRPRVVVTYDDNGGYGHPDHIQVHRVTMAAVDLAGDAAPEKVYASAVPRSLLQQGLEYFKAVGDPGFFEGAESVDDLPFGTPDELVTTAIDGREFVGRKMAALRCHRSQVSPDGPFFALPPEMEREWWGTEHYTLLRGELGPATTPEGWESDLFA
jgi:N-acetyl-1-D-myo-inositol-2-amino-2-deoxy-alpha-D-glucopyranoside deacetylase